MLKLNKHDLKVVALGFVFGLIINFTLKAFGI